MISRPRNIVISLSLLIFYLFQVYSDIFDISRVYLYHRKVKFYIAQD